MAIREVLKREEAHTILIDERDLVIEFFKWRGLSISEV